MRQAKALWIGLGIVLAIALLVTLPGPGIVAGMMPFGMMGFGMLAMVAFWGALIVGLAYLIRSSVGRSTTSGTPEEPGEILRRRYAAGEIDQETYERMRHNIAA